VPPLVDSEVIDLAMASNSSQVWLFTKGNAGRDDSCQLVRWHCQVNR
jgi:hypothetical protein